MRTKLHSMQTRYVARNLERPSVNRDIYPPTWSLTEEMEEEEVYEEGRAWWDHNVTWLAEKTSGYSNVPTAMLGNLGLGQEYGGARWGSR